MSDVSASFPASIEVDGFTIRKLKLSEYAIVFDKLQAIPGLLAEIEGIDTGKVDTKQLFSIVPTIVARALPEVIEILAIVTGKTREELDASMDLVTAVKCIRALFVVNDFLGVWEGIKEAIGRK